MPKKTQLELDLPGLTPAEAAERLKKDTKPSLFPSFSSPLRGRGEESMAGRITEDGFVVSPNDFGVRRVVATARGEFEETPTGTKARVDISIPPAIIWLLRASYLMSIGAIGFVGYEVLTAGEGVMVAGFLALFIVMATAATGWNVGSAEESIPKLRADVAKALTGPAPMPEPESASESESETELERLRRAKASSRQGEKS